MPPYIRDDDHYEELFPKTELWDAFITQLIAHEKIAHSEVKRMKGGSNIIYELGPGRLLKCFAPLYRDDALLEEAGLEAMSGADLGLPTPRMFERGDYEGWRWMVLERLDGVTLVDEKGKWRHVLDFDDRLRIMTQLAEWMRASWESDAFQAIELPERWSAWPATQVRLRESVAMRHTRWKTPQEWSDQVEPFFVDYTSSEQACHVHADLHGRNILMSERTGRWEISGILDFADTLHAPPLYDMVVPLAYLTQGDQRLAHTLYERCLGATHDLSSRYVMQMLLMHRFANLGYFARLEHVQGTTLEEMARAMTYLD